MATFPVPIPLLMTEFHLLPVEGTVVVGISPSREHDPNCMGDLDVDVEQRQLDVRLNLYHAGVMFGSYLNLGDLLDACAARVLCEGLDKWKMNHSGHWPWPHDGWSAFWKERYETYRTVHQKGDFAGFIFQGSIQVGPPPHKEEPTNAY